LGSRALHGDPVFPHLSALRALLNPLAKCLKVKFWWNYITLLEPILNKTNVDCASPALGKLARCKTQKFPTFFICGSPHTPAARRKLERKEIFGFAAALVP
jgi:hypothetical protein